MASPPGRTSPVLHALRLTGMAEAGRLVGATGLGEDELGRQLNALAAAGLVDHRGVGPFAGWSPTALGTREDDAALADELRATDGRARVEEAYRQFLVLNPGLLAACTDWQLVAGEGGARRRNDHTDRAHDAAVLARLADIHRRVQPVLATLSRELPRMARYGPRLQVALERVQAGDADWLTGPLFDSYHQVWFELHQDLLLTLGLDRGSEAGHGA